MAWFWKLWKGNSGPPQQENSNRTIEPTLSTRFDGHPLIIRYVNSNRTRSDEKTPKHRRARPVIHHEAERTRPVVPSKRSMDPESNDDRFVRKTKTSHEIEHFSYQAQASFKENETFSIDARTASRKPSADVEENEDKLALRKRQGIETLAAEAETMKRAKIDVMESTTSHGAEVVDDTSSNDQNVGRLAGSVSQFQSISEHPQSDGKKGGGRIRVSHRTSKDGLDEDTLAQAESAGSIGGVLNNTSHAVLTLSEDTAGTKQLRWLYVSKAWQHEHRDTASTQQFSNDQPWSCPSGQFNETGLRPASNRIPSLRQVTGSDPDIIELPGKAPRALQNNKASHIPASRTQKYLNKTADILVPPLFWQEKPQRRKLCTAREMALKPKQKATGPPQRAFGGTWVRSVGSPVGPTKWTG